MNDNFGIHKCTDWKTFSFPVSKYRQQSSPRTPFLTNLTPTTTDQFGKYDSHSFSRLRIYKSPGIQRHTNRNPDTDTVLWNSIVTLIQCLLMYQICSTTQLGPALCSSCTVCAEIVDRRVMFSFRMLEKISTSTKESPNLKLGIMFDSASH